MPGFDDLRPRPEEGTIYCIKIFFFLSTRALHSEALNGGLACITDQLLRLRPTRPTCRVIFRFLIDAHAAWFQLEPSDILPTCAQTKKPQDSGLRSSHFPCGARPALLWISLDFPHSGRRASRGTECLPDVHERFHAPGTHKIVWKTGRGVTVQS